jgi:hypothetical protein
MAMRRRRNRVSKFKKSVDDPSDHFYLLFAAPYWEEASMDGEAVFGGLA